MPVTGAAAPYPRRGDIWWVDFEPTRGSEIRKVRPAVIVSADGLNRGRRTVLVIPLSTGPQPRPPVVVAVSSAGERSVAICDQIRAVDKVRLSRNQGRVAAADMGELERALRRIMEL